MCLQGAPELHEQVAVHEALAAARLPAQIGAALLAVEERLASAGRLDMRWMRYWRDAWRHFARTLSGAPHALSLLASLQARTPFVQSGSPCSGCLVWAPCVFATVPE